MYDTSMYHLLLRDNVRSLFHWKKRKFSLFPVKQAPYIISVKWLCNRFRFKSFYFPKEFKNATKDRHKVFVVTSLLPKVVCHCMYLGEENVDTVNGNGNVTKTHDNILLPAELPEWDATFPNPRHVSSGRVLYVLSFGFGKRTPNDHISG